VWVLKFAPSQRLFSSPLYTKKETNPSLQHAEQTRIVKGATVAHVHRSGVRRGQRRCLFRSTLDGYGSPVTLLNVEPLFFKHKTPEESQSFIHMRGTFLRGFQKKIKSRNSKQTLNN